MANNDEPNSLEKNEASKRFTIRVPMMDFSEWETYMKDNPQYNGNMSLMIKEIVNSTITPRRNKSLEQLESIEQTLSEKLGNNSNMDGVEHSLQTITNLLNLVLTNQKHSQTEFTETVETYIKKEPSKLLEERIHEFVGSQQAIITTENIISYLNETCIECKRYLEKLERESENGGYWEVLTIREMVYRELYNSSGNEKFNIRKGGIQ